MPLVIILHILKPHAAQLKWNSSINNVEIKIMDIHVYP